MRGELADAKVAHDELQLGGQGQRGRPDVHRSAPPELHGAAGPAVLLLAVCEEAGRQLHMHMNMSARLSMSDAAACGTQRSWPAAAHVHASASKGISVDFTRHYKPAKFAGALLQLHGAIVQRCCCLRRITGWRLLMYMPSAGQVTGMPHQAGLGKADGSSI